MPNRILRESICNSPSLDALSAEAERLFYRMLTKCDDFGLFEADAAVVLGQCLPRKIGTVSAAQIEAWIAEMEAAKMVVLYMANGRRYGQFTGFAKHNKLRAKHPKHPMPSADICEHVLADVSTCEQMSARASTCKHLPTYTESDSDSESESDYTLRLTSPGPDDVPRKKAKKPRAPKPPPSTQALERSDRWIARAAKSTIPALSAPSEAAKRRTPWAVALDTLAAAVGGDWARVDRIIAGVVADDFLSTNVILGPPKLMQKNRDGLPWWQVAESRRNGSGAIDRRPGESDEMRKARYAMEAAAKEAARRQIERRA